MNKNIRAIIQFFLLTSFGTKCRKLRYRKQFTKENAIKSLKHYGVPPTDALLADMMNEAVKHDVTFHEYLMYHFSDLTEQERRQFIPLWEAQIKYMDVFNDYKAAQLFRDKEKTYERYKPFYKRNLMTLHSFSPSERKEFLTFLAHAKRVIVKPYDGSEGRGIRIFDNTADPKKLFEQLRRDYLFGAVIEEVVEQDESMASLHPQSVNTLRITTIRINDEVTVLPPILRVGRNGSIVDNGSSGGIGCELDKNGVIISTCDGHGRKYEYHPTTNKKMIGFQVPNIADAIALAKQLSTLCPEVRYVGWDIALSKDGFVMIEGNNSASFTCHQLFGNKNFRTFMDSMRQKI